MATASNVLQPSINFPNIVTLIKQANTFLSRGQREDALPLLKGIVKDLERMKARITQLKIFYNNQLENLQEIAAIPIVPLPAEINSSIVSATEQVGAKITTKTVSLADDLKMLETRILEGRKFNKDIFEESINARTKHLSQALINGNFLKGLMAMPELRTNKSIGSIVNETIREFEIVRIVREKEQDFTEQHRVYKELKNFRKKQKESKKGIILFIAKTIVDVAINNIVSKVNVFIETVKKGAMTGIASTSFGKTLINSTTRALSDVRGITKGIAKVGTVIFEGTRIAGKITDSIGKSFLPAIGVFIITGGSAPIAFGFLGVSTITKTALNLLKDPILSKIDFINKIQIKYGVGQFYDIYGKLNNGIFNFHDEIYSPKNFTLDPIKNPNFARDLKQLEKVVDARDFVIKRGNLKSSAFNILSKTSTFMTWGSIGGGIAVLLSPILGISPLIAGIAGTLIAGGSAVGIEHIVSKTILGKGALNALLGIQDSSTFLRAVTQIPFSQFYNMTVNQMWWGTQIDLIKNRYHGNFGAYWKDNWNAFENPNILKTFNVLSNVLNIGMSAIQILNPAFVTMLSKFLVGVFPKFVGTILSSAAASGIMAGGLAGGVAGIAIAMLLGVPFGPSMLLGAAIGAGIGTAIGVGVSLAIGATSFGVGFLITFPIATTLSAIGAWVGSLFDKAMGISGAFFGHFLQGMMAIFQLLSIMQQKVSFASSFAIAMSLVSFLATIYKMGVLDTANQCIDQDNCPATISQTSMYEPNITKLSSYNINILQEDGVDLSPNILDIITSYLDDNLNIITNNFPEKEIYLNLATSDSYSGDKFVIIGVEKGKITSYGSFQNSVDIALGNLNENTYSTSSTSEPFFLNVSN